jgi:hypothetical protein
MLNGHYTFQIGGKMIYLNTRWLGQIGSDGIFWGSGVDPQFWRDA